MTSLRQDERAVSRDGNPMPIASTFSDVTCVPEPSFRTIDRFGRYVVATIIMVEPLEIFFDLDIVDSRMEG